MSDDRPAAGTASSGGSAGTAPSGDREALQAPVVCATCGTAADPADGAVPLTWARGTENGRDVWTCPACSRQHLRSIEGKLDSAWW